MATKAFVLIETSVGKTREVVEAMKAVSGVVSVDAVTGPYDIIAVLEADDLNTIGELVTNKVHTVGSVVRTVTCLAVSLP
jgi:DNA-binding Lrp family transcriptional regulator